MQVARLRDNISYRQWMKKSEEYKKKVTEALLSCSKMCNGYKWWRERSKL